MKRAGLFLIVAVLTMPTRVSAQPIFAGTWILDLSGNNAAPEVWGQSRARQFVISQTPTEITIDTLDGSVGVARPLTYQLDGSKVNLINDDLGDLPGFTRRVRTWANVVGAKLTTYTLLFAGEVTSDGGSSITRVRAFEVFPEGRQLRVELTGYRPRPPALLHGRPYKQADDLVYGRDVATYLKTPE